ncbi:hypothetical protein Tco_1068851 [Tanacetum coccineum]|uniref:Uncharacterized protein n=1 Tax=Tanacetum coccineum TaxID=301880 RepID=A0ABQ5HIB1_9ASTR
MRSHATHGKNGVESEPVSHTKEDSRGIALQRFFIVSRRALKESKNENEGERDSLELEDKWKELALAGPDPKPMKEDQTGSDSGKLHVSLAGPNPEHMDDEFLATAYPKVHENLKLITDERVIDDNPESHSGSMSSMKNLEDTDNFGDQFLYDKPTEDDQEKSKVVDESDSTIPDPTFIQTQEMSEVKKSDHSTNVLASIKSQVPTAVDKYLGTKLDDALLKNLDLKECSSNHMIKNMYAYKNPPIILYHALMEALIADEDAMDKEVKDRVKNHKESMTGCLMMKTMYDVKAIFSWINT